MSVVSDRLRKARKKKGYTQVEVQKKTGIHNKTLSGYENEVSEPDIGSINLLSDLYEVSVDWLYGKTDDPKKKNNQASREIDENRKYLIDKIMRASDEVLPDLTIIVNRVIPDKD
ncbi:helix-turn-helix transcriptional regulator [Paenibacillus sp. FSL R7-0312]|uniref:helix-turn-helix domain-containing protein n=1 Tax=Paenibacillus TaxID=44249 RepID=UPI0005A900C7|nr:helix-turn-helix transcriptional regulator [Paenibacillus borealis]